MEQKTSLYDTHVKHGGKMVPFAGYLLPVEYETGVIAEHMAVRTACGIFDVSHMGEITCTGRDALKNLNHILTNDFRGMYDGQARYTLMCEESGGVVDDVIVYKVREEHYFIVVNAANKEKDFAWMKSHAFGDAVFTDISSQVAQIALQGPKASEVLQKLVPDSEIPKKNYSCRFHCTVNGMDCIISKTGYTGEDGFEFYLAWEEAPALWELLMETGKEEGLLCCGLGARDTLRLEASMPLYGHELSSEITPLEAGLGMFVKPEKEEFIGKESLKQQAALKRKRAGLRVTGRGIVRENTVVYSEDKTIGTVTSGTYCPYLKGAFAMALLDQEYTKPGTKVEADVRGRRIAAEVTELPFYKKTK